MAISLLLALLTALLAGLTGTAHGAPAGGHATVPWQPAQAVGQPARAASAVTARLTAPAPEVVLLGVPGLSWSDLSPQVTPAIWDLADRGAVAALSVRSVRTRACAIDGWLTLSAGQRAADRDTGGCRDLPPVAPGEPTPRWPEYLAAAAQDPYDAHPGRLAQAAADAGTCIVASGPGAELAATLPSGERPINSACRLAVIGAPALPPSGPQRQAAVRAVDALVGQTVDESGEADLIVAGIGDGDSPMAPRVLVASGTTYGRGLLASAGTRQPGLVELTDVTASLLQRFGAEGAAGRPLSVRASPESVADRAADLRAMQRRASTIRALSPWLTGAVVCGFLIWLAAWWRAPARPSVRVLGLAVAALPAATVALNRVPWERVDAPAAAACLGIAAIAALFAGLGYAVGRRRGPLAAGAVIWVATAGLLAADVLTGSRLSIASAFGYNPIVGGRFHGLGNATFAAFAAAALGVMAWCATRLRRPLGLLAPAAVLMAALVIDAMPGWGADFGGPPALLAGGVVLLAGLAGIRLNWRRLALVGVIGGAALAAVAYLDWRRGPGARTHLGAFLQQILDGSAGSVIGRKLAQNLANLTDPRLLLLTCAAAAALWLLNRRCGHPPVRILARAGVVLGAIGFAINDSGLVIPAFTALVLLPALAAHDESRTSSSSRPPGVPAAPAEVVGPAGAVAPEGG